MNITIFTSNNLRHNYLINTFSKKFKKIFVFQETRSLFPGQYMSQYKKSKIITNYFKRVSSSQLKIFKKKNFSVSGNNLELVSLNYGDLNLINQNKYKRFFQSEIYVVFGTSFIKGKLLNFLKKNKAINIHMGLSPFYRGTDCNFWALYDGKKKYVGATIHYLNEKLDSGKIIKYVYPSNYVNPFDFTMSVSKNVIDELAKLLSKKKIFKIEPYLQDKKKEIRYSKKSQFTKTVINNFYKKYKIRS